MYRMKRAIVLALLTTGLAGCGGGGGERTAQRAPAKVTPVPTTSAPAPTPTAEIHTTPSPGVTTATPTATPDTGGAQAGDEEGIQQAVEVRVSADRVAAPPTKVTAFLPVVLHVTNTLDKALTVVVMQAGDGDPVARVDVDAGAEATGTVSGLQPGTAEVLSPDLDPDATTVLTVERAH